MTEIKSLKETLNCPKHEVGELLEEFVKYKINVEGAPCINCKMNHTFSEEFIVKWLRESFRADIRNMIVRRDEELRETKSKSKQKKIRIFYNELIDVDRYMHFSLTTEQMDRKGNVAAKKLTGETL